MVPKQTEQTMAFQNQYQAGRQAFENGQYSLSVQYLEEARKLMTPGSRVGGEAQIWLVTAYEAAGRSSEAIALCRELTTHPHPEVRKQSKRLLYIIEAPRLKRPQEWLTEIPDLSSLAVAEDNRFSAGTAQIKPKSPELPPPPPAGPTDDRFIWVALGLSLVILISWLAFARL